MNHTPTPTRIAIILPEREGFSPSRFGAIALCVRDFTLHSKYREASCVINGLDDPPFTHLHHLQAQIKRHWWETRNHAYARACAQTILEYGAALVEVHNRPVLVRHLLRRACVPIALHLHNDPLEMKAARSIRARRFLLQHCAAIYCVSDFIRTRFLRGIADAHPKLHVVANGIEIPDRMPHEKENILLFAGRLTPNKGGLLFAQALERALPQLPRWKGIVIGGRRHAPSQQLSIYERDVAATLERIGPQAACEGFCPHDTVMDYFSRAAIAVVPSLWDEPFGRTALEAMSRGCAVITSGTGGLREVVADAASTPSPFTAETLAKEMIRIAQDTTCRTALQEHALKRAAHYAIAAQSAQMDALRAQILSR